MDAVVQQTLSPAGQHFFALIGTEAEIVRNTFGRIGHTLFAAGSKTQDRQHQCLIIGNGHGSGDLSATTLGLRRSSTFCPDAFEQGTGGFVGRVLWH